MGVLIETPLCVALMLMWQSLKCDKTFKSKEDVKSGKYKKKAFSIQNWNDMVIFYIPLQGPYILGSINSQQTDQVNYRFEQDSRNIRTFTFSVLL